MSVTLRCALQEPKDEECARKIVDAFDCARSHPGQLSALLELLPEVLLRLEMFLWLERPSHLLQRLVLEMFASGGAFFEALRLPSQMTLSFAKRNLAPRMTAQLNETTNGNRKDGGDVFSKIILLMTESYSTQYGGLLLPPLHFFMFAFAFILSPLGGGSQRLQRPQQQRFVASTTVYDNNSVAPSSSTTDQRPAGTPYSQFPIGGTTLQEACLIHVLRGLLLPVDSLMQRQVYYSHSNNSACKSSLTKRPSSLHSLFVDLVIEYWITPLAPAPQPFFGNTTETSPSIAWSHSVWLSTCNERTVSVVINNVRIILMDLLLSTDSHLSDTATNKNCLDLVDLDLHNNTSIDSIDSRQSTLPPQLRKFISVLSRLLSDALLPPPALPKSVMLQLLRLWCAIISPWNATGIYRRMNQAIEPSNQSVENSTLGLWAVYISEISWFYHLLLVVLQNATVQEALMDLQHPHGSSSMLSTNSRRIMGQGFSLWRNNKNPHSIPTTATLGYCSNNNSCSPFIRREDELEWYSLWDTVLNIFTDSHLCSVLCELHQIKAVRASSSGLNPLPTLETIWRSSSSYSQKNTGFFAKTIGEEFRHSNNAMLLGSSANNNSTAGLHHHHHHMMIEDPAMPLFHLSESEQWVLYPPLIPLLCNVWQTMQSCCGKEISTPLSNRLESNLLWKNVFTNSMSSKASITPIKARDESNYLNFEKQQPSPSSFRFMKKIMNSSVSLIAKTPMENAMHNRKHQLSSSSPPDDDSSTMNRIVVDGSLSTKKNRLVRANVFKGTTWNRRPRSYEIEWMLPLCHDFALFVDRLTKPGKEKLTDDVVPSTPPPSTPIVGPTPISPKTSSPSFEHQHMLSTPIPVGYNSNIKIHDRKNKKATTPSNPQPTPPVWPRLLANRYVLLLLGIVVGLSITRFRANAWNGAVSFSDVLALTLSSAWTLFCLYA